MQDLLLYSQIPCNRHPQVLNILAGITASKPTPTLKQHLILEQTKLPPVSKKNQANANVRRAYQHLVRRCNGNSMWTHRITEVPEPGFKQTLSRSVSEIPVSESDLIKFRTGSEWYKPTANYLVKGDRFVHGNVVINIGRIHSSELPNDEVLDSTFPPPVNATPLDPSGSYVIDMYIRLEDGSSTALRDQATKELLALAETLKGAVDMRVPDRLALDPRVKGS